MQHSKLNLQSYFSNRSNIIDKQKPAAFAGEPGVSSRLIEKPGSRRNITEDAAQTAHLKNSLLFKNMISCQVKTGIGKPGPDPSEEGDHDGSNLYSNLGNKPTKREPLRLDDKGALGSGKGDVAFRAKPDLKKTFDFRTKLGMNIQGKKSPTAESRPPISFKPMAKPQTGEVEGRFSKRLISILKK